MRGLMKTSRWACIFVLVLGVFVLHHEVLLRGMVYHNEDAADGYYPSHVAILRAVATASCRRGSAARGPAGRSPSIRITGSITH